MIESSYPGEHDFGRFYEMRSGSEFVLVGDGKAKRIDWPKGQMVDLYEGKDGEMRVVRVKLGKGEMTSPIFRELFPWKYVVRRRQFFLGRYLNFRQKRSEPIKETVAGKVVTLATKLGRVLTLE